jgi:hypothetical protein
VAHFGCEEIYGCEVHTVANVSSPETAASNIQITDIRKDWNGRHLCNELEGYVFGQIFVDFWLQPDGGNRIMASLTIPSLVLQPEIF